MDFNLNITGMTGSEKAIPLDPDKLYDILIVGGGPAGLTASVYCMRKGVSTGLVTINYGGQVADTASIENYMGYRYIEGTDLVEKFKEHVKQFELGISENKKVVSIANGDIKTVTLEDGSVFKAKTLIIASGKSPKKLNVPGEKELTGKGVAYCAICDAPLYKDKRVIVAGGGNSGLEAAIDLAKIAEEVTVVEFLSKLNADKIILDNLNRFNNAKILLEHRVIKIEGASQVEKVIIENRKTQEKTEIAAQGVFVEVGLDPNTDFAKDLLKFNEYREIIVDYACRTNVPGIFAAGDSTSVPFKQIIIAAGDGAKAALSACEYVLKI